MTDVVGWVRAAQAGDRRAFGQLVETFQRPVYSLAYRFLGNADDADDAAQEAFVKAYRAIASFDESRSFSTWLLSITAHHCIDRLRRHRLDAVSLDSLPAWREPASMADDPERQALRSAEAVDMVGLLLKLPDDHRLVVILRYWHDLGYAEIADMLGDTESAVKSRLHRARRQLAELMAPNGGPTPPKAPHKPAKERETEYAVPAVARRLERLTPCLVLNPAG